ncbi:MAG TPA: hypothetical protein VFO94_13855, partial [Gammaproteobacteria bacterium]|nr:hypothetical protein [Gammaproteobacteria bacterium]
MSRLILTMILAVAAVPANAARTIEYVEGAYEVSLSTLVLPLSTSGRLSVRPSCDRCTPITLNVDASTEYRFGPGDAVSLAEFRAAVTQQRQKPAGAAIGVVFY